jgi:Ca-activated chloride channel family protein
MFRLRPRKHPIFIEDDVQYRKPRRVRIRYLLMFIIALSLLGWSYQRLNAAVLAQELPTTYDSASHASSPHTSTVHQNMTLDDVEAGQLLLKKDTNHFTTALMQDSTVAIKISGMVAHVSVQQTFHNSSTTWVEGVYAFPLPDKAAVNRMRMVIGDRVIEGKIEEKAEAQKIYQQAKNSCK